MAKLEETKGLDSSPAAPIDAGSTSDVLGRLATATGTSMVSLARGRLLGTLGTVGTLGKLDGALKTFVNSCVTFYVTTDVIFAIKSSVRTAAVIA